MLLRVSVLVLGMCHATAVFPDKLHPMKVTDFASVESQIYRIEKIEDFEARAIHEIFHTVGRAEVLLLTEFPPPVTESQQYASVRLLDSEVPRVRLEFKEPRLVKDFCRGLYLWLHAEKLAAQLSIILEDQSGERHFLHSGQLLFRGWRQIYFRIPEKVRQEDHYLGQKTVLKIIAFEILFPTKYRKGSRPLILIDELTAELRPKYEIPPALKE